MTGFLARTASSAGQPASPRGPDGAIFVSDDYAGVVYRITAQAP